MLEENLRRAMILSRGDPSTFVTRPISAMLLLAAALVLVVVLLPSVRKKREEVFVEEDA
jgi:TctA family transporter